MAPDRPKIAFRLFKDHKGKLIWLLSGYSGLVRFTIWAFGYLSLMTDIRLGFVPSGVYMVSEPIHAVV